MQAFLHCSSSQADKQTLSTIQEMATSQGGNDYAWLSRSQSLGAAGFCTISQPIDLPALRAIADELSIDINLQDKAPKVKKLMLCDMDSTIITGESLDDLSEMAGIGAEVAAITARAMAGELDFRQALNERLSMLKDEPVSLLDKLIDETKAFAGAAELVATMRHHDAICLLVSGGFTFLTSDIAQRFGFSAHYANHLAVANGLIAGYAQEPIIDSQAKLRIMNDYCDKYDIAHENVMSMGDGANDIPMLQAAGLGIAWQAKPLVRQTIALQLDHSTLCGPLFLQGINEADIKTSI